CSPVPDVPPPAVFTYPLGPMGTLDLQLDVVAGKSKTRRLGGAAATAGGQFVTSLTVAWFANTPTLQRGVYQLGRTSNKESGTRPLPILKANQPRPLDLLSLIVSFEKVET